LKPLTKFMWLGATSSPRKTRVNPAAFHAGLMAYKCEYGLDSLGSG